MSAEPSICASRWRRAAGSAIAQLPQLADELRQETISAVSVTGGHLGAGLGVVELTVALHYVFDTPRDRLIWDVGHQAYPHKILTGRRDRIRTLRRAAASPASPSAARANTTRSARRTARPRSRPRSASPSRKLCRRPGNNAIAVIGDGAMSAGMAYEAMNNAGAMNSRLIVILNDNDMSIAPPVGAMSAYLARLVSSANICSLREARQEARAQAMPKILRAARASAEEYTRGFWSPAARCSRSSASIMSARSTATMSTTWSSARRTSATPRPADPGPCRHQEGQGLRARPRSAADKYHGVVKFDVVTGAQAKAAGAAELHHVFARR
jgi:1-deoxy-D-xylulose-5-phosphate synthase